MRKIIDCFTFFNELDLLEIRLKYLYDLVDYFVIVEADTTHSGNNKRYIFLDNKERFARFNDKIIYVPMKMKFFGDKKKVAWKRENYQRDCIKKGLNDLNLNSDDLILISDLDEIPDKDILKLLREDFSKNAGNRIIKKSKLFLVLKALQFLILRPGYKLLNNKRYRVQLKLIYNGFIKKNTPPINFYMFNHYYFINYRKKKDLWPGLQCLEANWLEKFTPNEIRECRVFPLRSINESGWHFSFLGGKKSIRHKLKNFAHQEFNTPEMLSDEYIDFCVENGYSLFDYARNPNIKPDFEKREISDLPPDLQKIVVQYKHLILQ